MKINEYALIKLIKNRHPVSLERTLDYYSKSIINKGERQAIMIAIQSKCLPQEMEIRLVRMFKSRR